MADYKNIPLGLRTQTQIPLDVKEYIQNESLLSNLGVNGQLAYTYTKGLVVYCIEEGTRWEWTEVKPGLEDTGLINQDFIYSDNHIAFGIDYSNKRYNFFPYNQSTFTVPDATTTIKGILKLANDLGGTADLPTTPTAIHKSGDEIGLTGNKAWTNGAGKQFSIMDTQGSFTAYAIGVSSYPAGYLAVNGVHNNLELLQSAGASGNFIEAVNPSATTVFSVNNTGSVMGNSFIKTGGTELEYLMADGSVTEGNPQKVITSNYTLVDADNNYTIFINNNTTAVTITLNSSVTISNFIVGFIQEGTGDVTFVGTGVTLTNPIGLKIKGQGYQTFIERELSTSTYYLLGNTKV